MLHSSNNAKTKCYKNVKTETDSNSLSLPTHTAHTHTQGLPHYYINADVMKMNLLASFWLRGECDHPHTGSLNLCVNVYVCIPIHSQYTEGSDHKSVLSMCFKARRLPLKGNVRVSSGTPVSEQGEENC